MKDRTETLPAAERKTRIRRDDAFKMRIGLEALLEIRRVSDLSQEHRLHPSQISRWRSMMRRRLLQSLSVCQGEMLLQTLGAQPSR